MPIIETTLEVTVSTWICNWCGRHNTAGASVPAELLAQHFIDTLGWHTFPDGTIACDRCRANPDVASILFAANHGSVL